MTRSYPRRARADMTSEVMEVMTGSVHNPCMFSTSKKLVPVVLLLSFSVLSVALAIAGASQGLAAFASPWAFQVALDLVIATWFAALWIRKDAQEHGIRSLPFLIALPFLGSIATLAYLVRRGFLAPAPAPAPARAPAPAATRAPAPARASVGPALRTGG